MTFARTTSSFPIIRNKERGGMSRAENREQKEIPRPAPVRTPATMGTPAETGSQPRGTNAASCARRPDGTRARIRIPAGLRGQDGEIGQKEPRGRLDVNPGLAPAWPVEGLTLLGAWRRG